MTEVKKEKNIAISILRMLMCYEVILCHYGGSNIVQPFDILKGYCVAVFMALSFSLTGNLFLNTNREKILNRCKKLLVPQVFWTIAYFVIYLSAGMVLGTPTPSVEDFCWQLFTGHSGRLNPAMWYQVILFVLTVIIGCVFYTIKNIKNALVFLNLMALGSIIMEYTGINLALFGELQFELRYPLGRLFEMIPYTALGIDFFVLKTEKVKPLPGCSLLWGGVLLIATVLIIVDPGTVGFGNEGLHRIAGAMIALVLVEIMPLNDLPSSIKRGILFASQYTLGIYCMHNLISGFLRIGLKVLFGVDWQSGMLFSLAVYVISFFVAKLLHMIPSRFIRQSVA